MNDTAKKRMPAVVVVVLLGAVAAVLALTLAGNLQQGPARADTPAERVQLDKLRTRAESLLNSDQLDRAEPIIREGLNTWPGEPDLYLLLSELLTFQGDDAGAYGAALRAIELKIQADEQPHGEHYFLAGTLASKIDDADAAMMHYKQAVETEPTNAKFALYLSQRYRAAGDFAGARDHLLIVTEQLPDEARGWGLLASMHNQLEEYEAASKAGRRARELQPDQPLWRLVEARALRGLGEVARAAELMLAIEESAWPRDAASTYSYCKELCELLVELEQFELAAGYAKRASERFPEHEGLKELALEMQ